MNEAGEETPVLLPREHWEEYRAKAKAAGLPVNRYLIERTIHGPEKMERRYGSKEQQATSPSGDGPAKLAARHGKKRSSKP